MSRHTPSDIDLAGMDVAAVASMLRRVQGVDNAYRSLAEKMGQLYLHADEAGLVGVTRMLDKPMRNASDNQQAFSALLSELQMKANQHG
ncbi:MAG: hypothetical protein C0445_13290 [Polaromonas sp.]|nr:hypothetical protein [Polaromonas sp.]